MKRNLIIKSFLILMFTSTAFAQEETNVAKRLWVKLELRKHFLTGIFYRDRYKYDEAIKEFEKAIELDPNFYPVYNEIGVVYREKGNIEQSYPKAQELYEQAISYHNKAIEINPDYEIAYTSLGYTYNCMDKYESAMRNFVRALEINPSSYRAHLGLGWTYSEMGLRDEAIREYKKTIKLNPRSAPAYHNLGWNYIQKGNFDVAIKFLKKSIKLNKHFAIAYKNLGRAYLHKGMFTEASQALAKAVSLKKDPYTYIYYYLTLLSMGKDEQAEEEYRRIFTLFPDRAFAHRAIGSVYFEYKQYEKALKEYEQALEMNQNEAHWWYELGNINRDMGKYDRALSCYQTAKELEPKYCSAWHEAGKILALKGEKDKALFNIKKAIENYPLLECSRLYWLSEEDPLKQYIKEIKEQNLLKFAWFYTFMGWIFEKCEDRRAFQMYEKAIAIAPDESIISTAYEGMGRIFRKKGDYEQAIKYFNKSMEVKPTAPFGHHQIAYIYYIQGENLKAIAEYEKALEKEQSPSGYLGIGYCWEKEGEIDKAIAIYKRAIENLPDNSRKISAQLNFLKLLSRFHLIGLYAWARKMETRIQKYFALKGLTPMLERTSSKIERIYKSKSPIIWIVSGLCILVILSLPPVLAVAYLIKRKNIIKPSSKKITWLEERMEEKVKLPEVKPSSFFIWVVIIVSPWFGSHLAQISPLLGILSIFMMIAGIFYEGNYGLLRRWVIKSLRKKLFRSYIETLASILQQGEKIWYYAAMASGILYYIVTSKRILCYQASWFGESIEKPLWICEFENVERIKQSVPFIGLILLGFSKNITLFLKGGSKKKIQFLPRVDAEAISKLIEVQENRK